MHYAIQLFYLSQIFTVSLVIWHKLWIVDKNKKKHQNFSSSSLNFSGAYENLDAVKNKHKILN